MGRKTIEKKCDYCNTIFEAVLSEVKRGNAKYCSKQCSFDSRIKTLYKIKCEECDKHFESSRKESKFCSKECANKNINRRVNRKNQLSEKGLISIIESNINISKNKYFLKNHKCKRCESDICYENRNRKYCNDCYILFNEEGEMTLQQYRNRCKFKFHIGDFEDEFDFNLIKNNGWYSPINKKNNLNGVSRDHIFSVKSGYILGIDPSVISHPANCRLILQSNNSSKKNKNDISLSQLIKLIEIWDLKYKRG